MFHKTHKQHNYLQLILKQKVFTKVIKMPSWKAWVRRLIGLIKRERGEAQALKARLQNCLLKVDNILK